MAGLSSVVAITRPLGEVNLAAMNRCTGVYRVYLNGGGGGGGGYDDFYKWYGGNGGYAAEALYSGSLVPPITLTAGDGGAAGIGYDGTGRQGGTTSMSDSRWASITVSGGTGGASAATVKSLIPVPEVYKFAKEYSRFVMATSYYPPNPPYFMVTTGLGGGSMQGGSYGGIIKAYRIG